MIDGIHPDLEGLTAEDFDEDCIWDTVAMKLISRPTLYKVWNSKLPFDRKLSTDRQKLPLIFIVRTNYRSHLDVRDPDMNNYEIPLPLFSHFIKIYDFKWLPLYVRLTENDRTMFFKLISTEKISLDSHVSNGTNLMLTTAKTAFIYEPVLRVNLNKFHCWFSLYPHRADRPILDIIRLLPNN